MTPNWQTAVKEKALAHIDLKGKVPPVDLDALAIALQEALNLPGIWLTLDPVEQGRKEDFLKIPYQTIGIKDQKALFALSEDALFTLINKTLDLKEKTLDQMTPLMEGYFSFLGLNVLHALKSTQAFPELPLEVLENTGELSDDLFVHKVTINGENGLSLLGRIIYPRSTKEFIENYYSAKIKKLTREDLEAINITLSLKLGETTIDPEMWEKAEIGDGLLIKTEETVLLFGDTPIFSGKIENNHFVAEKLAKSSSSEVEIIGKTLSISLAALLDMDVTSTIAIEGGITNADIYLQGKKIGSAELVRLQGKLALRITEKLS